MLWVREGSLFASTCGIWEGACLQSFSVQLGMKLGPGTLRKPWGWDFGVEGEWQEPQDERRGAVRPQHPPQLPEEDGKELCVPP